MDETDKETCGENCGCSSSNDVQQNVGGGTSGCVGCEENRTTVNVSTSVGGMYFNLSMTVFDDVPESRPMDAQLLKGVIKLMFNELRYKYATILKERMKERDKDKRERAARFLGQAATSLSKAIGGRAWTEAQKGEGESPEAVMPDETQAEVGRRIGNIFKKEKQTNE
jgi:hypothetical protein